MLFNELIKNIAFDDVWEVMEREYHVKKGDYEVYRRVLEELKVLNSSACNSEITLVVAKVEDFSEPGTYIFEVFGIKAGDQEHYGLEMSPWEEWLSAKVLEKSIDKYGGAAVVAHVLYEMTFFGYSAEVVNKRIAEEEEILMESLEDLEKGSLEWKTLDELKSSLGILDGHEQTDEEIAQKKKQFERIYTANQRVYKELLEFEK